MITNNIDIFKNKKVIGDIIPIHSQMAINAHEHFFDGDKFITVSRDGSVAAINSETLDVVKFENLSKHPITASEMIDLCGEKKLLLGNIKGELMLLDQNYKPEKISKRRNGEISSICDFGDGTIAVSYGDHEQDSTVDYISLNDVKVINEIKLQAGRKIKDMHRIQNVKDKCIVACSSSNIYWFKVIDGILKLLVDQASPDDYFYDEVWSDGKNIIKAGEPCYRSNEVPIIIKEIIEKEKKETLGKSCSMCVSDRVIIRSQKASFKVFDLDGGTIIKIPLPAELFAMKIKMIPWGRIILCFQDGKVGRFEFRPQSLRFLMS